MMNVVKIDTVRFFNKVKVLMLRGERGERPTITTTPIDNGTEVTFAYEDGTSESVELHNATSGDYSGLTNKPSINGVLLSGDKTSADLGLVDSELFKKKTINFNGMKRSDVGYYYTSQTFNIPTGYLPIAIVANPSITDAKILVSLNNDKAWLQWYKETSGQETLSTSATIFFIKSSYVTNV